MSIGAAESFGAATITGKSCQVGLVLAGTNAVSKAAWKYVGSRTPSGRLDACNQPCVANGKYFWGTTQLFHGEFGVPVLAHDFIDRAPALADGDAAYWNRIVRRVVGAGQAVAGGDLV
jgi:hypothetical protein